MGFSFLLPFIFSLLTKTLYPVLYTFRPWNHSILKRGHARWQFHTIHLSHFASLDRQISLAHLKQVPIYPLTWSKAADIIGICEDCVIQVDLARGVTILFVPGKVFAYMGCIGTYSLSKEAPLKLWFHSSSFINYSVTHTKLAIHGPIYSIYHIYSNPIPVG